MSSLQCLKRVHLEVNAPELARYSPATKAAFQLGHEVGELAVRLYGGDNGVYIDYGGGSLAPALARTRELMTSLFRVPICEATIQHDDVLVREDVLLPITAGGQSSWRVVEVKASTRLKPEHANDCAVQAWVHREAGYPLAAIALAHIDNAFVYPGGSDYEGLFVEHDLTAEVADLLPSVPIWVSAARRAVSGPLPEVPPGQHCTSPYPCPFMQVCWPVKGQDGVDYPITGLGGSRKKLGEWVARGFRDIRDLPAAEISAETQQRIHRVTCSGAPERLPGARAFVEELPFPRFYLETMLSGV